MGNAFVTVYMTGGPVMDRHPHHVYETSFDTLHRLAESVAPWGELIIVTDTLTIEHVPAELRDTVTINTVPPVTDNFFMARWDVIRDTLEARTDLDLVYVADGRDVIVVKNPWDYIEPGTLYTCTEPARLKRTWRGQPLGRSGFINDLNFHNSPVIRGWIRRHPNLVALNAGVAAADRETMLRLATRMAEARLEEHVQGDYTDMALFNFIAHTEFTVVGSERFIGAKCHLESDAPEARVLHVP